MKKLLLSLALALNLASPTHASSLSLFTPAVFDITQHAQNPLAVVGGSCVLTYAAVTSAARVRPLPFNTPASITPESVVFAFDLHDVMFNANYSERMNIFLHAPHYYVLFKHALNPFFMYDLFRLVSRSIAAEQVTDALMKKYPDLKLLNPTITEAINAQSPIPGTIEFIKTLKKKGFRVYLLSNIGERVLEHLKVKFPDVFSQFDGLFFCSAKNGYIRKPNPKMYRLFLEEFNLKPEQVIFVDDLKKNIVAANKLGMHGLLFACPEQLFRLLKEPRGKPATA